MITETNPILYACVAAGPTVLAELPPAGTSGGEDLRPLAARCLAVAPAFHRFYSHAAGGRIYAFLMSDPLVYFAVTNEALGKHQTLLFLGRLADSFSSSSSGSTAVRLLRSSGSDPLTDHCFQEEFLPELRRLALAFPFQEETPPPPPPPPSPPASSSHPSGELLGSKGRPKKVTKEAHSIEIPILDGDIVDPDSLSPTGFEDSKPAPSSWARLVRMIILIDLALCCILFAVWISVCRGFHCIAS